MTMRSARILAAAAAVACLVPSCKKEGGQLSKTAKIEIDPSQTSVEVDGSSSSTYVVTIKNTGQGRTLNVSDIVLSYEPASEAEAQQGPAFTLVTPSLPAGIAPQGEGGGNTSIEFQVKYRRQDDALTRNAVVTILNDDNTDALRQALQITFETRLCEPALLVPSKVDFALVTLQDVSKTEEIQLTNTGSCRLVIDWVSLEGPTLFSVDLGNGVVLTPGEAGDKITLDPPITIDANSGGAWSSTFTPTDGEPASAVLTIHSNDMGAVEGARQVELVGNSTGPRICVTPPKIEFGGKLISKAAGVEVTVKSCGTESLVITGIAMKTPDSSPDFSLNFSGYLPGDAAPSDASPLTLEVNQEAKFLAVFTPDQKNPVNDGVVDLDVGAIVVKTNAFSPTTEIPETGFGVEVECPQPVILVEEGEEVKPQTILHLHGEQSVPASGTVTKYSWTVEQPSDNKFAFVPAANFGQPTHEVNVGGTYKYCLDVCDSQFCSSDPQCNTTACKEVIVVPDEAIHCELTWDTPGDNDQFNDGPDAGADMDIHFLHPFATGPDLDGDGKPDGWFDIPYDVFWFNRSPEWESVNPNTPDNPHLDRDDTDGAGPENVNLDGPVAGRKYRVGVHYWDDHGFGFSYPRLKCYIWGQVVFDRDLKAMGRKMFKCDMWEAAEISWPQGQVTAVTNTDGSLKITPNYLNSQFVVVGGGSCGQQ